MKKLGRLEGHTHEVWSIAFSADGNFLVSGSFDQTIRFWDITGLIDTGAGKWISTLRANRPYEGMNILGATGLSVAQKATLKELGAVVGAVEGYGWKGPEARPGPNKPPGDLASQLFPSFIQRPGKHGSK